MSLFNCYTSHNDVFSGLFKHAQRLWWMRVMIPVARAGNCLTDGAPPQLKNYPVSLRYKCFILLYLIRYIFLDHGIVHRDAPQIIFKFDI